MIVNWTSGAVDQSARVIGLGAIHTWSVTVAAAVFDTTIGADSTWSVSSYGGRTWSVTWYGGRTWSI